MIANRTTSVSAERSVSEIQSMLAAVKASAVMIDYDETSTPIAIAFRLTKEGHSLAFRLPVNWQGVLGALKRERGLSRSLLTPGHAKRVSWRILKDWLRVQLSLIEAGASTIEEVLLPWALTADGQTVSQRVLSGESGLLRLSGPTV